MNVSTYAFSLFLFFALWAGYANPANACDRSSLALDSISFGATVEVYLRMEVGGGVTGSNRGASGATETFAFAFYGGPTLAPITFDQSITSDSTQVTNTAFNAGAAFGSTFTIGYLSPGGSYACINSTSLCGNAHTDVKQVRFELTELPDSIRLLGIEGDGNPFSGCFPDIDMLITFGTLPVEWVSFEAEKANEGVALKWTTANESNNARFEVEHSSDGFSFTTLGSKTAVGNSDGLEHYEFKDAFPKPGLNHYRLRQFDKDGHSTTSEVRSVDFDLGSKANWASKGQNPVGNELRMSFYAPAAEHYEVQVHDQHGILVLYQTLESEPGINPLRMSMDPLPVGVYHLSLRSSSQGLRHKILKI